MLEDWKSLLDSELAERSSLRSLASDQGGGDNNEAAKADKAKEIISKIDQVLADYTDTRKNVEYEQKRMLTEMETTYAKVAKVVKGLSDGA